MFSIRSLVWGCVAGISAVCVIPASASAQVIRACANPAGQLRVIGADDDCRKNETLVTWNTVGQQGPPGVSKLVYSGSVNPNGTPQETGFTVTHTAGTGLYQLNFPAGAFSGSTGNFIIATVTPINPKNVWVDFMSAIAPIAADGSAAFSVEFFDGTAHTETLFSFIVAVAIH